MANSKYSDTAFWLDAVDRAISTVAQAAIGTLTAGATGLLTIDYLQVASVAGLAGLVSVLSSIAFRGRDTSAPAAVAAAPIGNGDGR